MKDTVEVEEEWNPNRHIIKVNGEVIRDEPNPYPYNPVHEMEGNSVESDIEL